MVPGASVLPIDEKGNVFLTKEFHYGVERVTIEVISGAIDEGETPIEAAKRELKEEVGLLANKWIPLGFIDPFTQIVACPNHLFIAEELSTTPTAPEGTEQIETLKIPYDKVFEMVMEGKITHGASIAVILKAKIYLQKNINFLPPS